MDKESAIVKLSCIIANLKYKLQLINDYNIDCCDEENNIIENIKKAINYIFILKYGCNYNFDKIVCFIDDYYEECNNVKMRQCDVIIRLLSSEIICSEAPFELSEL